MNIVNILIKTKASFINPWTKKPLVAGEPVPVPYDNLCRSFLRDGSFERVEEYGVRSAECGVKSGERDEGSAEKKTGKKEQREEKIIKNENKKN